MKKLNQILAEGVYDPGIFKAFFLAGGPGSGKTFVTRSAFTGTGLKVVNSDTIFERGLKKAIEQQLTKAPLFCFISKLDIIVQINSLQPAHHLSAHIVKVS